MNKIISTDMQTEDNWVLIVNTHNDFFIYEKEHSILKQIIDGTVMPIGLEMDTESIYDYRDQSNGVSNTIEALQKRWNNKEELSFSWFLYGLDVDNMFDFISNYTSIHSERDWNCDNTFPEILEILQRNFDFKFYLKNDIVDINKIMTSSTTHDIIKSFFFGKLTISGHNFYNFINHIQDLSEEEIKQLSNTLHMSKKIANFA
jgi:hypothetical protein